VPVPAFGGNPYIMPLFAPRDVTAEKRSDPIAAVMWVTIAMALFAGLAVFARMAMNAGLHPFVVVFLRNLFAVAMLLPLLVWRGSSLVRSPQIGLYGFRVAISFLSMLAWFYAISLIPIGEVMAIGFLAPLFGTLGAIFLLGEKVRMRRWGALLIGFAGAMIILRPGGAPLGLGQICAVLSAVLTGVTAVLIKQLTSRDDPDKIVFLTNVMLLPLSLLPALLVWNWPTLAMLPPLLGMGVCAVVGHVALVRGYAATDASLAQTFEFSRLPFTVAIAYVAFGETIDIWTWIGALIIFASAVYITRREAQLRRQATQYPEPPRTRDSVFFRRGALPEPPPQASVESPAGKRWCGAVPSRMRCDGPDKSRGETHETLTLVECCGGRSCARHVFRRCPSGPARQRCRWSDDGDR
jgi:drug/metabolite transporter (DMT)-like permease